MIFRTNVLNIWSATLRRRLLVAVTEPLEVVVRPLFGKNSCRNLPVAVTAPLEVVVRPQFGKNSYRDLPVAVTEPLEVVVRALFGQKSSEKLTPNQRRSQIDKKRL